MTNWTREDLARELPTMRDDGESSSDVASVKLFTPWAGAAWKLSEFDPATGIAFGWCDLGLGMPELGYVSVDELLSLRGPAGLRVERDDYYSPENVRVLAGLDS